MKATVNEVLRHLPSVDELLRSGTGDEARSQLGEEGARLVIRDAVENLRREAAAGTAVDKAGLLERAASLVAQELRIRQLAGLQRVVNATGVIVHTNLGRAPLSAEARDAVLAASGYCTLEYDLERGSRGRRGADVDRSIAELVGAEDAIVVNNGAAAAFFVLSAFAAGGEVIVSRGELVEIGGDFRVPDILTASGAVLREVGTTNRTHFADYERAVGEATRMILRVHPSNYRIVGFTSAPPRTDLVRLAHERGIIFYEDLGSGALIDTSLPGEPLVADAIADGADLVSFSGDKLLGGPQSGIIAGSAAAVERLRKHPLFRVLRCDKLTYAALGATIGQYHRGTAAEKVPVVAGLRATAAEIAQRVEKYVASLGEIGRAHV